MTSRCAVIEIMGTPGAGKSTVAAELGGLLAERGISILHSPDSGLELTARSALGGWLTAIKPRRLSEILVWRAFSLERLVRGLLSVAVRPRLVKVLVSSQLGRVTGSQAGLRRPTHWLIRMAGERAMFLSRSRRGEVLVIDEGFCHRVVQLFTSVVESGHPVTISDYISAVPAPGLVVRVAAPVELCVERIQLRGVWDRLEGDEDGLRAFVANAAEAIEMAAHELDQRRIPLVTVPNTDGDMLRHRLVTALESAGVVV